MLHILLACAPSGPVVVPGTPRVVPSRAVTSTISTTSPRPAVRSEGVPVLVPAVGDEEAPAAPVGADLAAELFLDGVIPEFDLELSEDAIDDLREEPYVWVEGALVHGGARFEPVGVRLKGQNSFLPIDEKPSIKVKLDLFVPGLDLLGLDVLVFDNMSTDTSMMHERVSYRLFRERGLPASRSNHAVLRINGEDRGLYAFVENVDDDLLELWYPDPSGSLWELADVEFVEGDVDLFEHERGPEDREPLERIAAALESDDAYDEVSAEVDWAQFVDFVGAAVVVGQFDCYPWRSPGDDAHLYFDPADGRMDLLPHGMDETFRRDTRDPFDAPGLLMQACLASDACTQDYVDSIWEAQEVAEAIGLRTYAESVRDEIAHLAEDDPRRPYDLDEVDAGQDEMLEFIEDRRDRLSELVGDP